jgi:hypothetical protein
MAGLFLASPAIRSCFVDTLSGFKAPSCFSETTLFTTVPRFPRSGPPRAAFPDVSSTIRALRLPVPTTGPLIYSLARCWHRTRNWPIASRSSKPDSIKSSRLTMRPSPPSCRPSVNSCTRRYPNAGRLVLPLIFARRASDSTAPTGRLQSGTRATQHPPPLDPHTPYYLP